MRIATILAGVALAAATSGTAHAACTAPKAGDELTGAEAQAVYDCLKDSLHAGYQKGKKRWVDAAFVRDYNTWTRASAFPAAPGFHGGRFLVTYVNDIGAEEYLKYKDEDVHIPAGTKIAKESFSINGKGKVTKGPLFLMEKVEKGKSPKTDDWYYTMVSANGAPQAVNVYTACSECHQENYGQQGGLGYPAEDARIQ
ncbi:cytochrome P460 family protein [Roseibium sediminis]|uniref:cytochrome P460 family protein n=1 Tax=Roseibium sediminis TaxID=1775174 RepID=UPI00123E0385|nr:cytochrome P460 family protein [Roseibium sediminis]